MWLGSIILACMVVILWWRAERISDRAHALEIRVTELERFQEAWRGQQELARAEANLERKRKLIRGSEAH